MTEVPVAGDYRWTLAEFVLRCELGSDIRQILVEGSVDRDIVARALQRWGSKALIFESDFLRISHAEIQAAGFARGVKGKLLTVASALEGSKAADAVAERVAVVVDRDYDGEPTTKKIVLVTDGYSIENYAFNPAALQRFSEQVLGRAPRPRGADGRSSQRNSCTGDELYRRLYSALVQMAAVRLAFRRASPELKPFSSWPSYVSVDSAGTASLDGTRLVHNVATTAGRKKALPELEKVRERELERSKRDPMRWVRGRDFVDVLTKVLQSSWGRKRNGRAALAGDDSQLARLLLFAVDPEALDASGLFTTLRERFAGG